ncbi:putative WRKY transcription factor 10 [Raphanus sativus]|nr:putative WRKY transcription factor 10 [Raphanus sativus]
MSDYIENDNGINPISETSSQTNLRTDPQSERRSGGVVERVSAMTGRDIPPLDMECLRPFSNSFRTPNLVHSPIRVASPRFNTLSPSLQSPNMFTISSSQIIHPIPIPNDATQEMVESSGCAHATMMISNNNPPHQPMDVDLPPQKVVVEMDAMNLISLKSGSEDDDKDK